MRVKIILLLIIILISFIGSACNQSNNVTYEDLNEIALHYEEKYEYLLENEVHEAPELPDNIDRESSGRAIVLSGGPVELTDEEFLIIVIRSMRHELESTPSDQLEKVKESFDNYIDYHIKVYERNHK